jgi:hypothetical protein
LADVLARNKGVVTALEHEKYKVLHDGLSLEMKVAEHCIGAPPVANKADDVRIHSGEEEGHSPAHLERAGSDIIIRQ